MPFSVGCLAWSVPNTGASCWSKWRYSPRCRRWHRFALTARFENGQSGRAALGVAIGVEAIVGAAVVLAAALLASQEPCLHADPVWHSRFAPA